MERTRGDNLQKIAAAEQTIRTANAARMEKEAAVEKLNRDNRALTDERERMSGEMARLAERRTAAETELNDTNSKLWEEYQLTEGEARSHCVPFESLTELRRSVAEVRSKIRGLGNVNVGAIDEYKEVKERYDFLKAQVTDVEKAKSELTKMIAELCSEMEELFTTSFKQINTHFQQIFKELFGGGHARLYLSDEANVLESGIEIEVSPPGKVIKNLSALSGGEQEIHGPQAEDGEHVAGIDEEGVVRDGDDGRDRVEREHHVGHFHHKQAQEQRRGLPDQLAGSIGGLHEEIVAAELVVHGDEALGVPDGPVLGVVAVALELILLDLVHVVAVLFGDGRESSGSR